MKKILRYGPLALLALIVLALLVLPNIAKEYVINNSKELIGRQVYMDKLAINYFNGKVSVYDFKMFEPNEKDAFISFDTLVLNTVPYKYLFNVGALDQFYLDGLVINISKKDSVFNFDDLVALHMAKDSTESTPQANGTFKYILNNLELKRANLNFYDGNIDQTTSIDDFSFFVPHIYWDQENQSNADLKFNIADGGRITSNFHMQPKTGEFDAEITVAGLQLRSFYKYAAQYAHINAMDGAFGSTIKINGNIHSPKDIRIASEATLENFELRDQKDQIFMASKKIDCIIPEIDLDKKSILVRSLDIDSPYINFELDSISNNYARIFDVQDESNANNAEDASESRFPDYLINSLKVSNGLVDYSDNLTGKPFDYHFSAIKIDSDSISSKKDWVDIKSDMLLNGRGTLQAEIGLNPKNPLNAQIDIAIKDFLLSDLDIYSNYYMGHSILVGDMIYFSNTKLTHGNMEMDNRLLIKNVAVKNNKGGLYSLPLKLAVWVLKDKNGDIELNVPVTGAVNDPQVDTWALVWATLKKRIFNATDNPVRPLARYIGAKPDDIQSIAFHYPDTLIAGEKSRQLDLILELEEKKKNLQIEMNFLADPKILHRQIAEKEDSRSGIKNLDPAITDRGPENTWDQKDLSDSLTVTTPADINTAHSSPLDSLATDYADAIIRNVRKYIMDKRPESGIVVQKAKISNSDQIDAKPQIKVRYSMDNEEDTPIDADGKDKITGENRNLL